MTLEDKKQVVREQVTRIKQTLEGKFEELKKQNNNELPYHADLQYFKVVHQIVSDANIKMDRTGVGTVSIFGTQQRYDLKHSFPLLTSKKVAFKLIVSELLWFLRGDTNIRYLLQHNNHIWDEWAFKNWANSDQYKEEGRPDMTDFALKAEQDEEFNELYQQELKEFCQRILDDETFANNYGELGEIYGRQWRAWKTSLGNFIDQIKDAIDQLKNNPNSRRIIVTAWNPEDVPTASLPPCHVLFQFYADENGDVSCQLYQRSADTFLGVPFNIASYALLTILMAHQAGRGVSEFIHTTGDTHLYLNHLDQIEEQIERDLRPSPQIKINHHDKLEDYTVDDFELVDYNPHPPIKAPVAV